MNEPTHEQAIDASNVLIDWILENADAFYRGDIGQVLDTVNRLRSVAEDCVHGVRTA